MGASLECGGLALWSRSNVIDNKAAPGRRTPRRRPRYNPPMNSETLPIITTPRVLLRWISEDDIDGLYEIFSNPQVMRYWSTAPLADREAAAQLQREIADGNESDQMFKWGLALR